MSTIKAGDRTELNLHDWSLPSPKASVALLHGYGEHAGRYQHVAEAFNKAAIGVVAVDLRGHGRSAGIRGHVERFSDYYLDATAVVEEARKRSNGSPVFLMAHSMGALLALDWLLAGGGKDLAGVVLSSPFLGVAVEVGALKALAGRVASRVMPALALPIGVTGADVCRDPEKSRLYDTDPLNLKKATARWYTEVLAAIDRVHENAGRVSVPALLLYADQDRVVAADATDRLAAALTMSDKTTERLRGLYHEIMNEAEAVRAPIIERIAGWILDRAESAGPRADAPTRVERAG